MSDSLIVFKSLKEIIPTFTRFTKNSPKKFQIITGIVLGLLISVGGMGALAIIGGHISAGHTFFSAFNTTFSSHGNWIPYSMLILGLIGLGIAVHQSIRGFRKALHQPSPQDTAQSYLETIPQNKKSSDESNLDEASSHESSDESNLDEASSHESSDESNLDEASSHESSDESNLDEASSHESSDEPKLDEASSHDSSDEPKLDEASSHDSSDKCKKEANTSNRIETYRNHEYSVSAQISNTDTSESDNDLDKNDLIEKNQDKTKKLAINFKLPKGKKWMFGENQKLINFFNDIPDCDTNIFDSNQKSEIEYTKKELINSNGDNTSHLNNLYINETFDDTDLSKIEANPENFDDVDLNESETNLDETENKKENTKENNEVATKTIKQLIKDVLITSEFTDSTTTDRKQPEAKQYTVKSRQPTTVKRRQPTGRLMKNAIDKTLT